MAKDFKENNYLNLFRLAIHLFKPEVYRPNPKKFMFNRLISIHGETLTSTLFFMTKDIKMERYI